MGELAKYYLRLQQKLAEAQGLLCDAEPPPCVGCMFIERCAVERKACWTFYWYAKAPDDGPPVRGTDCFRNRWRRRFEPRRDVYDKLYKEIDDAETTATTTVVVGAFPVADGSDVAGPDAVGNSVT